jgi:hypothetical protein
MKTKLRELHGWHRWVLFSFAFTIWIAIGGCSQEPPETLTIAFSNDLRGEIRSCGCPANDFGGLGRRATLLEIVRDSTDHFLLVDAGDFFGVELNYGKEKADVTMKSMAWMGYDAVVIGEKDFGFGVDYIVRRTQEIGLPVVVANVYDAVADTLLFPPSWVVEYASGLSVGLIGVMGNGLKLPPQVPEGVIRITEPIDAIKRELEEIRDRVEYVVVVAHLSRREAQAIATDVPEVDLVVFGHEGRPSGKGKSRRFGNAFLLQSPGKGLYLGVAFAVLDGDGGIRKINRFQHPLSKDYEDHEAVAKLFRSYDMNVAAKEKSDIPSALFDARAGLKKPFAGSEACRECHETEYAVWKQSKHAEAFAILEGRARQYDRDCIPCHTTGFYKRGGFEHVTVTPELVDVGCESCHGNGHDHESDPGTLFTDTAGETCRECHNDAQSPNFDFDAAWDRIRH